MTVRQTCPEAPWPWEAYAQRFDDCFGTLAQRRAFRGVPAGAAVAPRPEQDPDGVGRDEPLVGAQHPVAQQLQYFLSEATWGEPAVAARRRRFSRQPRRPGPTPTGCWSSTTPGIRKDGTRTALSPWHTSGCWQGGQRDRGGDQPVGRRADLLAAARRALRPRARLPGGLRTPPSGPSPPSPSRWRRRAGGGGALPGDGRRHLLRGQRRVRGGPAPGAVSCFVLGLKPSKGAWVREHRRHAGGGSPTRQRWDGPTRGGTLRRLDARRAARYRDGHTEVWWATEPRFAGYRPEGPVRLVVATTDPVTLPHPDHLVPGHEPAPAGRPGPRRPAVRPRRPGRGAAPVRPPELGGTRLGRED